MRHSSAIGALLLTLLALGAAANPEPDPDWAKMRDLVLPMCHGEADTSAAQFSRLVAQHGLAPLEELDRQLLEGYFARFEYALVDGQRVGEARALWPDVHRAFKKHASFRARTAMCEVLRPWLLADSLEVSLRHRVEAAEHLSDYADAEAIPMIVALADSLEAEAEQAGADSLSKAVWYLRQAARRVHEPDAGVVLRREGDGGLTVVREPGDIVRASYSDSLVLKEREASVVLLALGSAEQVSPPPAVGGTFRIEFADGVVAVLAKSREENVHHYSDNHRLTESRIGLESHGLRQLFWRLGRFGVEGIAKTPN